MRWNAGARHICGFRAGLAGCFLAGILPFLLTMTEVSSVQAKNDSDRAPLLVPSRERNQERKTDPVLSALETLESVSTGRSLIRKAWRFWELRSELGELRKIFRWGMASRTDAVLTRHYDPSTGKERRERQVVVYLREHQAVEDLVLDIAHELVHATVKASWDPYDPALSAGKYILITIEGDGGEVEALMAECQVSVELADRSGVFAERCLDYLGADRKTIHRAKVRQDFYKVGKWAAELKERLGPENALLPLLSPDKPKLYSSTGSAPYPVALFQEYNELTEIACANSRRRLGIAADRSIAAAVEPFRRHAGEQDLSLIEHRCQQ